MFDFSCNLSLFFLLMWLFILIFPFQSWVLSLGLCFGEFVTLMRASEIRVSLNVQWDSWRRWIVSSTSAASATHRVGHMQLSGYPAKSAPTTRSGYLTPSSAYLTLRCWDSENHSYHHEENPGFCQHLPQNDCQNLSSRQDQRWRTVASNEAAVRWYRSSKPFKRRWITKQASWSHFFTTSIKSGCIWLQLLVLTVVISQHAWRNRWSRIRGTSGVA